MGALLCDHPRKPQGGQREESHTAQVAQTREVYERVISVLDRIIVKLDTQHVDVMYELRARRAASAPRTDIHQ